MKCAQCRGVIEGDRTFCPHCGAPLSVLSRLTGSTSRRADRPDPSRAPDPSPRSNPDWSGKVEKVVRDIPAFVRRDSQTTIASGVVAGCIIGAILPGVSWFVGGLIGGFLAYKYTERK